MRALLMPALLVLIGIGSPLCAGEAETAARARTALRQATEFLRSISTNGGYVGRYSLDLEQRFGEAEYEQAGNTEIWVEPPGTPTVGETFLRSYRLTAEERYLKAARDVGRALAWGQRAEGGWDHRVDVSHLSPESAEPDRRSGHCTFDDDISQAPARFLMNLDEEIDEPWLTGSIQLALDFVRTAQFDNGAWPQWSPLRGGYHDYYTFNDNAINDCIRVMLEAHRRYGRPEALDSARRGGEFIIASQRPAPQPGWAQQYSHDMEPARARRFEPPGICSAVTARNIRTLVDLYLHTGDETFLEPIPAAIDWLDRSRLAPDQFSPVEVGDPQDRDRPVWARLYEVGTNKPIYGDRTDGPAVIYDVNQVSRRELTSYGWQGSFGIPAAIRYYRNVREQGREKWLQKRDRSLTEAQRRQRAEALEPRVRRIIAEQDDEGRWVTDDRLLIGTFVRNMDLLCDYLHVTE